MRLETSKDEEAYKLTIANVFQAVDIYDFGTKLSCSTRDRRPGLAEIRIIFQQFGQWCCVTLLEICRIVIGGSVFRFV